MYISTYGSGGVGSGGGGTYHQCCGKTNYPKLYQIHFILIVFVPLKSYLNDME